MHVNALTEFAIVLTHCVTLIIIKKK